MLTVQTVAARGMMSLSQPFETRESRRAKSRDYGNATRLLRSSIAAYASNETVLPAIFLFCLYEVSSLSSADSLVLMAVRWR